MTIEQLRTKIESHEFAAEVGVASGYELFNRLLQETEGFRELVGLLRDHDAANSTLFNLVKRLSEQVVDHRYENPNDTAMAAYLRALSITAPDTAAMAAVFVLSAHNTWWSRRVADVILSQPRTQASSLLTTVANAWQPLADFTTIFATTALTHHYDLITNFWPASADLQVWDELQHVTEQLYIASDVANLHVSADFEYLSQDWFLSPPVLNLNLSEEFDYLSRRSFSMATSHLLAMYRSVTSESVASTSPADWDEAA